MSRRAISLAVLLLVLGVAFYVWRHSHPARNVSAGDSISTPDDGSVLTPDGTPVQPTPSRSDTGDDGTGSARPSTAAASRASSMPKVTYPGTDSVPPNPEDGVKFTGSGKYQIYRQGNLTWRLDTETGHTCILFATEEEWRKPIVYTHGCNNQ